MGNTPTKQTFTVKMPLNCPTYILGIDVPWLMNTVLPSNIVNGAIADVLTLEKFAGYSVTSVNVSGSRFYGVNGHLELDYVLTTVSDPINAGEVAIIIGAILLAIALSILTAVSLGVLAPSAAAAWILVGSTIAGTIAVAGGSVAVVESGAQGVLGAGGGLGAVAVIAGIGVVGVIAYMYLKEPKRHAAAHRYVGKAKSAAKSAAQRLR